eukprot:scaffold2353_cov73-Skeletonema_marinoi.AAC.5
MKKRSVNDDDWLESQRVNQKQQCCSHGRCHSTWEIADWKIRRIVMYIPSSSLLCLVGVIHLQSYSIRLKKSSWAMKSSSLALSTSEFSA